MRWVRTSFVTSVEPMQELLFLSHRMPYPPDKGDKIRSWHFLKHLAGRYRVHLGCFIDDPRDWQFTDLLRDLCDECCVVGLNPRVARLHSLSGLLDGRPLTLPYYTSRRLHRWVQRIFSKEGISRIFVYCSAMAQYVPPGIRATRCCVADLVDVDSEKWLDYARTARAPSSWLWRREGKRLRQVELEIAHSFKRTLVSTAPELELLNSIAPDAKEKTAFLANGVDTDYFSPDRAYAAPPLMRGTSVVFTGAMDYRPNIDAVLYFAHAVMPVLRAQIPDVNFYVVGSNPRPEILALSSERDVIVTGRVPDVRPYLAHAKVVVAPLRIARGIQNKVLEGMAMAKPVVASAEAFVGIDVRPNIEAYIASDAEAFAKTIGQIVDTGAGNAMGSNARRRILADHQWSVSLDRLDAIFEAPDHASSA